MLLDRHYEVIAPKDDELKIRDGSDDHKDKHVDEPIKAKVEHDLGVVKRSEFNDKIVSEVCRAFNIKSIVNLTIDNATL